MDRGNLVPTTRSLGTLCAISLLLLAGFSATIVQAESAKTLAKRGADAEARQDYDAAFEDYRQAVIKKPTDLRYKTKLERVRFLAAATHVDRGRILKQSGELNGAANEFTRALQIDPSNQTAQQELQLIEKQMSAPPSTGPQGSTQEEVLKDIGAVAGPIELKPVSDAPITIHAVEDVKNIYQAIGKSAGLNVLFDPDYTSKRIPVDLTNVSLADALRIVGTIAGTFYKPVTPNTIFVAQNTRTKRTELDEQAVQTFYLTNAAQQQDANEVLTALRNVLDPSIKITLVASQNAIIVRATPDQLLLAQKLINDLDRSRSEVVVDVALLEVNRDKTRALGISLPTSITLTPQASPGTTTSSSSSTTSGSTSSTPSNFTLNTLANLNATNFAVTVGGGTLTALLSDSDTRVLQNPRIRATDGQRAQLKIGSRIPVATGSYNAGVATGVASIGVQTQFTYIDIGVNIDMTPSVHYDREVTLKLKIEDLTHASDVTISGVTEPVIGQRSVEQVIQLKDGEPSILAGILTQQDNLTVAGTPGIGELPFFKWLFSTQTRQKAQDEIVFLLIPHIVRESLLTHLNTRAVDTGTGQSIELRRDSSLTQSDRSSINPPRPQPIGQGSTAANAVNAAAQQILQQASPPQPPSPGALPEQPAVIPGLQTPTAPAQNPASPQPQAAGPPMSFTVVPSSANPAVGSTFSVTVNLTNARDVYSVPLQLQFNPSVLQLVNVDSGDLLARDGQAVSIVHRDEGNGLVTIATSRPPNTAGITGQGSVATLTFKAVAPGDSNLSLVKVGALNSSQANLPSTGSQAVVHVK